MIDHAAKSTRAVDNARLAVLNLNVMYMDGLSEAFKNKVREGLISKGVEKEEEIVNFINALDNALKKNPEERDFSSMTEFANSLLSRNQ